MLKGWYDDADDNARMDVKKLIAYNITGTRNIITRTRKITNKAKMHFRSIDKKISDVVLKINNFLTFNALNNIWIIQ